MGWTIPLWGCHYERSEESAFVSAGTTPKKQQIPRRLKSARDAKNKELDGAPKGAPLQNTC
jgi:hypothetical protein